jgi:hypothetical protein
VRSCAGYDRGRRWQHLDLAGMWLHLRDDIRRFDCPTCGVKVEQLPWAETGSWLTRPFEDHVLLSTSADGIRSGLIDGHRAAAGGQTAAGSSTVDARRQVIRRGRAPTLLRGRAR